MLDKFEKIFIEFDNEWGYLVLPEKAENNIPLVLHFHGNGGYVKNGEADWIDESRKQKFFFSLLESGYAIAGCHATGNHWGRDSALKANYNFFEELKKINTLNLSNITTWGCGLGASAAWLASIGNLNPYVENFVSQQGVLNFESIIQRKKFKNHLIEAHSEDLDLSIEDAIKLFHDLNPITRTKKIITNPDIRIPNSLFIHGDIDENVNFEENPVVLHNILNKHGYVSKLHPLKDVGHATYEFGDELGRLVNNFISNN